eukprot:1171464-Pleurochrysis_carterae.AAC.1
MESCDKRYRFPVACGARDGHPRLAFAAPRQCHVAARRYNLFAPTTTCRSFASQATSTTHRGCALIALHGEARRLCGLLGGQFAQTASFR